MLLCVLTHLGCTAEACTYAFETEKKSRELAFFTFDIVKVKELAHFLQTKNFDCNVKKTDLLS